MEEYLTAIQESPWWSLSAVVFLLLGTWLRRKLNKGFQRIDYSLSGLERLRWLNDGQLIGFSLGLFFAHLVHMDIMLMIGVYVIWMQRAPK